MNREIFYKGMRESFGPLSASQVKGTEALLNEWNKRKLLDIRQEAYILATSWHETARTMQPIREFGRGRGKTYGTTWYGRGYVQLTWQHNYQKMQELLGVPLTIKPDLALDPDIAAQIIYEGMTKGLFTGKRLTNYFNSSTELWINARRIVNGLDKAELIASYGKKFHAALLEAQEEVKTSPYPTLRMGMAGEDVEKLQNWLQKVQSSKFDLDTDLAVRQFQEKYGLTVDGIVGSETWTMLRTLRGV